MTGNEVQYFYIGALVAVLAFVFIFFLVDWWRAKR